MAKIQSSIKSDEKEQYDNIISTLIEEYNLGNPRDLMLLDITVKDFLRIQRIHKVLTDEGDFITVQYKNYETRKAHEAGFLLNAVETQLRNNLKELGLTRKEHDKKVINELGKGADFSEYFAEGLTKVVAKKEDEK